MSTISWLEIFDKYNTQEIIMGKILKKVPGGFIVNVFGTEGFLPGSQVPQSLKEKGEGIVNNDINIIKTKEKDLVQKVIQTIRTSREISFSLSTLNIIRISTRIIMLM